MNLSILGSQNLNLTFLVYADVTEVGFGVVLFQRTELGTEEILAYGSCSLNPSEKTNLLQNLNVWIPFGLLRSGEFTWRDGFLW